MPLAKKSSYPAAAGWALPLLVLALAVFVYSLYGFDQVLLRDYSIYLYSGQRMAEGIPPYVSVFDHKGPLSPMLAALGVAWSKELNWDDVYTVRLVFYLTACLTAVAVLWRSSCGSPWQSFRLCPLFWPLRGLEKSASRPRFAPRQG